MSLIDLILSANKISLIAFLGILVFLVYELSLLNRERQSRIRPSIPNFNPQEIQKSGFSGKTVEVRENRSGIRSSNKILLIALFLMLVFFGLISIYTALAEKNKTKVQNNNAPKVIIQTVNSKGIKLFSLNWEELTPAKINSLKSGEQIIIGLETIPDTDVDYARIRVNSSNWETGHITNQFNTLNKVFYQSYIIPKNIKSLIINAQLHSKQDGWLGD